MELAGDIVWQVDKWRWKRVLRIHEIDAVPIQFSHLTSQLFAVPHPIRQCHLVILDWVVLIRRSPSTRCCFSQGIYSLVTIFDGLRFSMVYDCIILCNIQSNDFFFPPSRGWRRSVIFRSLLRVNLPRDEVLLGPERATFFGWPRYFLRHAHTSFAIAHQTKLENANTLYRRIPFLWKAWTDRPESGTLFGPG